jgi:Protein of unknown function (DUF2905)
LRWPACHDRGSPARARPASGDILVQRELFTVYAPVTTGILVSTVPSLNPWVFSAMKVEAVEA